MLLLFSTEAVSMLQREDLNKGNLCFVIMPEVIVLRGLYMAPGAANKAPGLVTTLLSCSVNTANVLHTHMGKLSATNENI